MVGKDSAVGSTVEHRQNSGWGAKERSGGVQREIGPVVAAVASRLSSTARVVSFRPACSLSRQPPRLLRVDETRSFFFFVVLCRDSRPRGVTNGSRNITWDVL